MNFPPRHKAVARACEIAPSLGSPCVWTPLRRTRLSASRTVMSPAASSALSSAASRGLQLRRSSRARRLRPWRLDGGPDRFPAREMKSACGVALCAYHSLVH